MDEYVALQPTVSEPFLRRSFILRAGSLLGVVTATESRALAKADPKTSSDMEAGIPRANSTLTEGSMLRSNRPHYRYRASDFQRIVVGGIVDTTSTLQAALNEIARGGGGSLTLEEQQYSVLSDDLYIPSNVALIGSDGLVGAGALSSKEYRQLPSTVVLGKGCTI